PDFDLLGYSENYLNEYLADKKSYLDSLWIDKDKYYSVIFNGLEENIFYIFPVREGESLTDIPSPQRDNYTFAGWYYEGTDIEFDPKQSISEDITLYAKWKDTPIGFIKHYFFLAPLGAIICFNLIFIILCHRVSLKRKQSSEYTL
ncbi:MAG: InlB B-repeat-containing protein, partial [Bacillota bacterium]